MKKNTYFISILITAVVNSYCCQGNFLPSFQERKIDTIDWNLIDDVNGDKSNEHLGLDIALSGDGLTVAAGSTNHISSNINIGRVQVFHLNMNTNKYEEIGQDIIGVGNDEMVDYRLSLSDDGLILALGQRLVDTNSGRVRIYRYIGGVWTLQSGDTMDGGLGDEFGSDVSLSHDGNILAVGARRAHGIGYVDVYKHNRSTWVQQGGTVDGQNIGDEFGVAISLSNDGQTLAIGAFKGDGNEIDSGNAQVYSFDGINWTQKGSDIDGQNYGDWFGARVSLSSDASTLAIGAMNKNNRRGQVQSYEFDGTNWVQKGNNIDGQNDGNFFGVVSLSYDGNVVAVSAQNYDGIGDDSGQVQVFEYDGSVWNQRGNDIYGEAAGDQLGFSIALSGDGNTLAISALNNDGGGRSNAGNLQILSFPELSSTPTLSPDSAPSLSPDSAPSLSPDSAPSLSPHSAPSLSPHSAPSLSPHSAPSLSPDSTPSLSPSFSVETGFSISTTYTSNQNNIQFSTMFGPSTDKTRTELLDGVCNNAVSKVLYKTDSSTTHDGKLVIDSTITVEPSEIENSRGQRIFFSPDGTFLFSPSSVSGIIQFCLRSTSIQALESSNTELDMKTLEKVYNFTYSGTATAFSFDMGAFSSVTTILENAIVIHNVLVDFNIIARRCYQNSTDAITTKTIGEDETLYLCIKSIPDGGIVDNIDLNVLYSYNTVSNEYEKISNLISGDVISVPDVVTIGNDELEWTRLGIRMISSFIGKLRLQGSADAGFIQTISSQTDKFDDFTNSRSSFGYDFAVISKKEEGCIAKALHRLKSTIE